MSETSSDQPVDEAAARAELLANLRSEGYVLEGVKQEAVESEARSIYDRARSFGFQVKDAHVESVSDSSQMMKEVDGLIRRALDMLRSSGIDKPLAPLAWALYHAPIDEQNQVDLAIAFRAADSQMLVTRFNQETDPAAKEVLKQRLRNRALLRSK